MQIFSVGVAGGAPGENGGSLYTMWKLSLDPNAAWSEVVNLGNPGYQLNEVWILSVGYLPDNRMQVFVAGDHANVYSIYKLTTDPNSAWSSWTNLGNPATAFAIRNPSVGYLPDGRMQIFVVGDNVYSIYKLTTDPDSAWSNWTSLGNPLTESETYNTIAVGRLPDDTMQIFIVGYDYATQSLDGVYTKWKLGTDPNSAWSDWTSFGSPEGSYAGDIAVGYLPGGAMQIFICTREGGVYTSWKLGTDPNSAWSNWTSLGLPGTGLYGSFFPAVSVGYLPDGRMQIFVMNADANVYTMWKLNTDPNSAWSSWTNLGNPGSAFPSFYNCGIGVGNLPDDRMQIFLLGNDGNIYTMWKLTTDPDSAWSSWVSIGSAGPAYSAAEIAYGVAVGYLLFF